MLRKALVIGSNGPDNYGQLQHAVSDSIRIATVLSSEKYCFDVDRLEPGTDPNTALNRLTTIAKSCNRQDTLIFYFSGHGECRDGDLFLLLDTTEPENLPLSAFPISWIIQIFNHCRAENKLLVLDCCYADAGRNNAFKSGGTEPIINQPLSALQKITIDPQNYLALLAGDHLEKTREIEIEHRSSKLQGGFLTVHIYLALTDRFDEVDGDDDGKITVEDLKNWLFIQANEYNSKRTKEHHIPRPMLRGRTEGPFYLNLQSNLQKKEAVRSMGFPQKFLGDYTHLTYDRRPVLSHRLEDLDSELVENFLKQPQAQRLLARHKISQINREEHLKEIGVINNDGQITLGSFLCFAPRQLLTDKFAACSLQTVIYGGKKRGTARLKHSEVIRGNLLYLFIVGMQFLTAEAGLQPIGEIGTSKRDELEIPEIALREALANALVHRDYQSDALKDQPTRIEVYPDRVEITSYGVLLDGVSEEDLNNNPEQVKPFRRNHIVAEIFRIMQNAELNASGVSRMHEATQQVDLPLPHISQSHETHTVTVVFTRRQFSSLLEQLNYEDLNALVHEVRTKTKNYIQERCGTMRVLDMTQPVGLGSIYIDLNILEKPAGRQRLEEITELLQSSSLDGFDRLGLGRVSEKRIPGLEVVEQYTKLMILGGPGSGKTTFLKYLAINCISGQFQAERVPIFVTLKDFAESSETPSLLDYIAIQFSSCSIREPKLTVEAILSQGRGFILLDGLDEIRAEDSNRALVEIRNFSSKYHSNQFVITCRIAARDYIFSQFIEVEIADFGYEQINHFAQNWFSHRDPRQSEIFLQRLQENRPIQELAANPLLLTMLCLVFEEAARFPANRSELYEYGVSILLSRWDATRNIERDQLYKSLSAKRKEDLLSQIAFQMFIRGEYFFKQRIVEREIQEYLRNLPYVGTEPEVLQVDSQSILKSIESQSGFLVERARGIYSFSHITFHEYFAARKIVTSYDSELSLKELAVHITEKRWREVLLLTVEMLPKADSFLLIMKFQVDSLLAADAKLQDFLAWLNQKTQLVIFSGSLVAVRNYYFALSLSSIVDFSFEIDRVFLHSSKLDFELELDLDLSRCLTCALELNDTFDYASAHSLISKLNSICARNFNLDLKHELQQIMEQLLHSFRNNEADFKYWWQSNGSTWIEQLRSALIKHRNIGHDWQFINDQLESLRAYYDSSKLLMDCLNSDCYVSREVRAKIEAELLLPITQSNNSIGADS